MANLDLAGIDLIGVDQLLATEFNNPELMLILARVCRLLFSVAPNSQSLEAQRAHVHQWLGNLERVDVNSAYGEVYLPQRSDLARALALKVKRGALDEAPDLLQEYEFMTQYLNPLRSQVPNFAYALGAFRCSTPGLEGWCQAPEPATTYLILERVAGDSLREATDSLTLTQWLRYIMQASLALKVASEAGIAHGDLHTDNVLLRPVPGLAQFYLPYRWRGETWYLLTDRVLTIIDFGSASVGGDALGALEDLFSLIFFTYLDLENNANRVLYWVLRYSAFFTGQEAQSIDEVLALDPARHSATSLERFIEHLLRSEPGLLVREPVEGIQIFDCEYCLNRGELLADLNLPPSTVEEAIEALEAGGHPSPLVLTELEAGLREEIMYLQMQLTSPEVLQRLDERRRLLQEFLELRSGDQ